MVTERIPGVRSRPNETLIDAVKRLLDTKLPSLVPSHEVTLLVGETACEESFAPAWPGMVTQKVKTYVDVTFSRPFEEISERHGWPEGQTFETRDRAGKVTAWEWVEDLPVPTDQEVMVDAPASEEPHHDPELVGDV